MAKIYSPNQEFNGDVANVTFINGYGESDSPYLIDYFKQHGYIVKEDKKAKEESPKKKVKVDDSKI
jgi:hypothetical protein